MTKIRNSKVELFRIFAAISVLIVHFNGWFLGGLPDKPNLSNSVELGQSVIASLFAICVNCFILISGFFGVHLRLKSVWKLIIQLLGIFVPMYLLSCFLKVDSFSVKTLVHNCLVISRGGYFVQCYFLLLLISPLLNLLFEQKRRRALLITIFLVLIEFWFDCIMNQEAFGIGHGYQAIHFIVIYCCGRCVNLYKEDLLRGKDAIWMVGYLICSILTWLLYVNGFSFALNYSSLFVIAASVCIFVPFLRGKFENKFINWLASGCFAVYIVQVVNPAFHFLCIVDASLMTSNVYAVYLLKVTIVIVLFFIVCVLYDILREWATTPINKYCYPIVEKWVSRFISNKRELKS